MDIILSISGIENKLRGGPSQDLLQPASLKANYLIAVIHLGSGFFQKIKKVVANHSHPDPLQYPPGGQVYFLHLFGQE
jgi:hypothetical protein